ncbi:MAG: phage major capsid protein [Clostridia bacterium]|nr:phage major capsid protein [Clostridia bacterium]
MISVSNASNVLKDYYLDAFNKQLNEDVSPFFNAISKTTENVYGKDVKFAMIQNDLTGVSALGEEDDLPGARAQRYLMATVPLKNLYGTIEISDKAVRASSDSTGAFIDLLNAEMEGLIRSAKANFARMLYGDGNGTIGTITQKVDDDEIVVNNIKQFYVGMKVKVGSDTTENTITAVDYDYNLITLAESYDDTKVAVGDKVQIVGATGNELLGLAYIFDNSTLYGNYKSQNACLNPVIVHSTLAALTEEKLIDVIDRLEEANDEKINMILCSHKVRKKIASLMSASRRIVNSTDIAAGYSSIFINDVPVYADKYCPDDRIYFVNTDDFALCQLCDWSWIEDESGRVLKQIAGKAAYSATLVKYAELICKRPCNQGAIYIDPGKTSSSDKK